MLEYTKSPLEALALYHGSAVAAAQEWRTRITYYMQALLAALWVFSPFCTSNPTLSSCRRLLTS